MEVNSEYVLYVVIVVVFVFFASMIIWSDAVGGDAEDAACKDLGFFKAKRVSNDGMYCLTEHSNNSAMRVVMSCDVKMFMSYVCEAHKIIGGDV